MPCHAHSHVDTEDTENKEATLFIYLKDLTLCKGPLDREAAWITPIFIVSASAWTALEVKKRSSLGFAI